MTQFVIDASVAAKWFLPPSGEPLTNEAVRLLAGYAEGRFRFAVPDLFWVECGNISVTASAGTILPPPTFYHLRTTVPCPPSTVYRLPSTVYRLPFLQTNGVILRIFILRERSWLQAFKLVIYFQLIAAISDFRECGCNFAKDGKLVHLDTHLIEVKAILGRPFSFSYLCWPEHSTKEVLTEA